jgi:O-antigen ligase
MTGSVCIMLAGLWALLSGTWRWEPRDNPVALANATFAVYALGSAAVSLSRLDHLSQLEQFLPFLGAPLLGIGFRMTRLPLERVGCAFALGAAAAAAVCLWQMLNAPTIHRAEILVFSTWLGTAGALYAVLCGALAVWAAAGKFPRLILILGAASGTLVALLSGSKGSWLVLAACGPVLLVAGAAQRGRPSRSLAIGATLGFVALGIMVPNSPVIPRLKETLEVGGDRLRAAYWQEAGALFRESPVLGSGREALRERLLRASLEVRAGVPLDEAPNDAHNEYLDILATRGLVGLLLALSALAVPCAVFWRLRSTPGARAAANTGLLFIFAFAVAGLTDVQFAVNMKRMLYLFTVLLLLVAATTDHRAGDGHPR